VIEGKVAKIIVEDEISRLDKKEASKLAEEFDVFLAEGPVMLVVGKYLGQFLAPKGKMPRPIQPDLSALESALRSVKSGIRVTNKKGKFMPVVQALIGKEDSPDEQLAENAFTVYQAVAAKLPDNEINIKSVFLKTTMGPAVKVEAVRK
jgi:large subunit ribosomal protein L1